MLRGHRAIALNLCEFPSAGCSGDTAALRILPIRMLPGQRPTQRISESEFNATNEASANYRRGMRLRHRADYGYETLPG